MFSFGKTLHATGLRVGYCVAPPPLTRELRKVHQFNTFSIAHPLQHAIAAYLDAQPDAWRGAGAPSSRPSATCCARPWRGSGFALPPAQGTYFQLLDFSALRSRQDDLAFAERLLTEARRRHHPAVAVLRAAAAAAASCACASPSGHARSMQAARA